MKYAFSKVVSILIAVILVTLPGSAVLAQASNPPEQIEPLAPTPRLWLPLALGGAGGTLPPSNVLFSDYFDDATKWAKWEKIDPLGDSRIRLEAGHVYMTLDEKNPHIVWRDGYTTSYAPRIMQAVDNPTSFTLTVKFDTRPRLTATGHGIWIESDTNDFIRYEFFSDAANDIWLYAATINGGVVSTPLVNKSVLGSVNGDISYLKLTRSGNTYTFEYWVGSGWLTVPGSITFSNPVTKVGIYASNSYPKLGTPDQTPAFEMAADYFLVNP